MGGDVTTIVDEDNLLGKASHDTTGLLFLSMSLHVHTMKDNIMGHVTGFLPVHSQDILTLCFGECFVVVEEVAFWFHRLFEVEH